MTRLALAATLIAALALPALAISPAAAKGRSKDERKDFWQTLHQEAEPWKAAFGMDPGPTAPAGAPAAHAAKAAPLHPAG
ncbi:hypothetical protein [Ancylobacter radicis]|uniref:Lytic murein transglycosylase n=1 Tax=Ancylobacter radicis TaxID=2836179 RepID=A0ABS5RAS4_9HYPH|nr:hypothetical protein [Ancylobacter radicis]MBS9478768.1 hypothetical protein [Ancylobacter radicis]